VYFLLLANAAQLVYISLLYYFNVKDSHVSGGFHPVYALYIIVGLIKRTACAIKRNECQC